MVKKKIKLGVNIDHIATLRNVRKGEDPNIIDAVKVLKKTEIDSITVHLREDRRHINDDDVVEIKKSKILPLNLEMAATNEMQKICLFIKPFACCIVPERREELTTEGGLNVKDQMNHLKKIILPIIKIKTRLSLFVDPDKTQIKAASELGVSAVEIHTGQYAEAFRVNNYKNELNKIKESAEFANKLGLECHAGHGLNYNNVTNIASISQISELNVGHFLIGQSIFLGLNKSVIRFKNIIKNSR